MDQGYSLLAIEQSIVAFNMQVNQAVLVAGNELLTPYLLVLTQNSSVRNLGFDLTFLLENNTHHCQHPVISTSNRINVTNLFETGGRPCFSNRFPEKGIAFRQSMGSNDATTSKPGHSSNDSHQQQHHSEHNQRRGDRYRRDDRSANNGGNNPRDHYTTDSDDDQDESEDIDIAASLAQFVSSHYDPFSALQLIGQWVDNSQPGTITALINNLNHQLSLQLPELSATEALSQFPISELALLHEQETLASVFANTFSGYSPQSLAHSFDSFLEGSEFQIQWVLTRRPQHKRRISRSVPNAPLKRTSNEYQPISAPATPGLDIAELRVRLIRLHREQEREELRQQQQALQMTHEINPEQLAHELQIVRSLRGSTSHPSTDTLFSTSSGNSELSATESAQAQEDAIPQIVQQQPDQSQQPFQLLVRPMPSLQNALTESARDLRLIEPNPPLTPNTYNAPSQPQQPDGNGAEETIESLRTSRLKELALSKGDLANLASLPSLARLMPRRLLNFIAVKQLTTALAVMQTHPKVKALSRMLQPIPTDANTLARFAHQLHQILNDRQAVKRFIYILQIALMPPADNPNDNVFMAYIPDTQDSEALLLWALNEAFHHSPEWLVSSMTVAEAIALSIILLMKDSDYQTFLQQMRQNLPEA